MKKIILLLLIFLLVPCVFAKQGHMKLLAVSETPTGYIGKDADLYLEILPGNGRVFIETFPLAKLDTQISTRFAKEIACDFLEVDCNNFDFIYTIKANSPIIGGPSAGSSLTILTISLLEEIPLRKDVAITGTINSGGFIGSVGAIKEKIDAANNAGIKTVLIPEGESIINEEVDSLWKDLPDVIKGKAINQSNITLTAEDYAKKYNITVIEVSDLSKAFEVFTGKRFYEEEVELTIDDSYEDTMKLLGQMLCNRSKELWADIQKLDKNKIQLNIELIESAVNLSDKGTQAFSNKTYYSAASFCFGANFNFQQAIVNANNYTKQEKHSLFEQLKQKQLDFETEIDSYQIKTITDLQAYMVVKERLKETKEFLNKNDTYSLAYSAERLFSAQSWAHFFNKKGKEFDFNKQILKESCEKKLSEAEERFQYVSFMLPGVLEDTRKEIDYAIKDKNNEDFELCLFKASKAKAETDIILNLIGVSDENVKNMIDSKIKLVKRLISKQIKKGIFPILGYSYYEYASTLKDENKYSSLLYLEYALELSNLEIYFKEKKDFVFTDFNSKWFLIGLLSGYIICLIIKPLGNPQ